MFRSRDCQPFCLFIFIQGYVTKLLLLYSVHNCTPLLLIPCLLEAVYFVLFRKKNIYHKLLN
jgi:hypothetical protein